MRQFFSQKKWRKRRDSHRALARSESVRNGFWSSGGSERIRTFETVNPPTRFRVVRLQPLGHASTYNYITSLCYNTLMDQTFSLWLGVIAISLIGTLAHFLYDIMHHSRVIGLFAAVNESTWEHIKIAITPTLLWGLYDGFFYGENPNYFAAKFLSLITLVIFIPCVFYSYKKISKKPILFIDIATFYIAIILSQVVFYAVLNAAPMSHIWRFISCICLFVFFGCYMTLTLEPLKTFLFKDPITGKYGFRGHSEIFKKKKK